MASPVPTPDLHTGFSAHGATPTPWEDVVGVLESAELFWISTVRSNGRPHVTPLPAVWRDGALYFCTGPGEQKARNLRANAQCALATGTNRWKAGLDVVVESRSDRVTDDALLRSLTAMWETKYDGDWQYDVRDGAFHHEPGMVHVFEVRPRVLRQGRVRPDPVPLRRLTSEPLLRACASDNSSSWTTALVRRI